MRRLSYLLLCLFISIGVMTAQTVKITGIVVSADDDEPVIGASIVVKGTTIGTVTNYDGTFSLDVPSDAKTLVFSYIGMKMKEEAVKPQLRVALHPDLQVLDEVVVTAMGLTREKKALGYAVQEIKSEAINQGAQKSIANALSGKIAGVQITSQGGQIGASQSIVIRGNSSLSGSNEPLIVVDGVPVQNDNGTGATVNLGSGINDINPEDIESVSVLKGGSAALYGMRAGKGVILITTKSGKKAEKKVTMSYTGDITIDRIYNLPKYQNKYGQGYVGSEFDFKEAQAGGYTGTYQDFALEQGYAYGDGASGLDGSDESWGPRLDVGLNLPQYNSPVVDGVRQATPWVSHPNNIKDFFQTGYSMNHTISLNSSTETTTTRASLSFRDQKGTVPNTDQKRYSAAIKTTMSPNKYIDFDLSANFTRTESENLPGTGYNSTNPTQSLMQWFGRQVDLKDLKQNWDQRDEMGNYTHYNWISVFHANPYWVLNKNLNGYERNRFYGKSSLFIKPTDYLKFEARIGLDNYASNQLSRIAWDADHPDGYYRNYDRRMSEINADFVAYFKKQVSDFSIDALLGANYRDYKYEIMATGADELTVPEVYTVSNAKGTVYAYNDHSGRRSNSVYGNLSIGYKSQAYLDISMRNDWDSTIEDDFFYPSVSGSWILTETFPAIKNSYLNFLKLRGGWANIGSATDPYVSGSYFEVRNSTFNGVAIASNSNVFPPQGLKPENVETYEVGLETSLLDDRLRFDIAGYKRTITDQILNANVATSTAYKSMYVNAGKVSNKGVEIQLSGDVIRNANGFNWTVSLNWSKDKSKIEELYENPVTGEKLEKYQIGSNWQAINYAIPGKSWGTLVGTGYVYNEDGSIQVKNGVPVYQAAQEIGDVTPDWLAGITNEFSYKNLRFGFLLDFRKGGDIYSMAQGFNTGSGLLDFTAAGDLRENGVILGQNYMTDKVFKTADGQVNTDVVNPSVFFDYYYTIAQMAVFDGSYLKLREAHITYTFPKSLLQKVKGISAANVSLVGNNLALLWVHKSNLTHTDPESTTGTENKNVGFEQNSFPPSRSFGLKLAVTF